MSLPARRAVCWAESERREKRERIVPLRHRGLVKLFLKESHFVPRNETFVWEY